MRLKKLILLSLIFTIISISAFSQQKAEISSFDTFSDLIDIVISTENPDSLEIEVPDYLSDLVCDYYDEDLISDSVPLDVLSFLESVYSEHGYNESGGWASPSAPHYKRYVPYDGELPDYDFSDFKLPVVGRLTSKYGYRPRFQRYHRGIDIALNSGDTVVSALPGVVVKTGYEHKGYGSYVVVAHSGSVETVYAHLGVGLVAPGQKVMAGQPIGIGGSTGNSTGPHLHFETRYFGTPVDPFSWFNISPYLK